MEVKLCRICGKEGESFVHIFKTEGLKNKIETCLPIVVMKQYTLPDIICMECFESVDNFYNFIKKCLQNIIVLEAQYEIIESCLKTKRKVDRSISVEPCDLLVPVLPIPEIALFEEIKNSTSLVDYECTSDSEEESPQKSDIIEEIVQRKCLKRKIEPTSTPIPQKQPRIEESSSRRKKNRPKRVEYHLESTVPAKVEEISEATEVCLLCESKVSNVSGLSAHMYEVHGIDLSQIYGAPQDNPPPKKKMPELVKISDVIGMGKLPPKLTVEIGGNQSGFITNADDTLEITQIPEPSSIAEVAKPTMSSLNDSLFLCSECPSGKRPFTSFQEFSTHRRSQHQIFHCDLCPKFYGRNSHLWKHVHRVHKGHSAVTCSECGKTSASEYHLQQHKNKMHAAQKESQEKKVDKVEKVEKIDEINESNEDNHTPQLSGDEDDLLNQKFQGFDFKSVKQSFLRQELMNKRQRYVSVLKKNNVFIDELKSDNKEEIRDPTPPPKEIDTKSDLYTTIITNYTPPTNEGPYKCPKCFKGFHKKNLVKKHKKNCRPRLQKDLLTRCKTCSRIFKDRQSLAKHLVNYHSEYTCEICSVAVQSKCEIVSHIRFQHPGSELQCHCGQILRSKADLARHKSEHRDSHVCQFCGDQLPTKIKLKMHILSLHRKILALSCGICLKLFETQHVLRAHVKHAHADQLRPLTSCTVCGKNYGSKWKTYDHLNKSHGRIFKACKSCLEVFETEKDLQNHFEREHVNNGIPQQNITQNSPQNPVVPPQKRQKPKKNISEDDQELFEDEEIEKNKFSLLEKRLLSNKKPDIEIETNDDIFQNSSKRTVYVNSNDPSLCEICLKVWPAKKHLWQHYIRCHKQTAATVCGICLKTNPSYSALQRHLCDTHPKLLHGQGFGSNFICKICGRYHNASSKLRLHMAIHVGYVGSMGSGSPRSGESGAEDNEPVEEKKEKVEDEVEDEQESEEQTVDDAEYEEQTSPQLKSETQTRSSNSNDSNDEEDVDSDEESNDDSNDDTSSDEESPQQVEEVQEVKQEVADEDDVYYESLIEEVEASDEEEIHSEEDLERQMLRNMMCESRSQRLHVKLEPKEEIQEIELENGDEDEEYEVENSNNSVKLENNDEEIQEIEIDNQIYTRQFKKTCEEIEDNESEDNLIKSEIIDDQEIEEMDVYEVETFEVEVVKSEVNDELSSAIRSICAGNGTNDDDELEDEVEEVTDDNRRIHRVNESELETAVGSIL